jgi:hypothetical protein
MPEAFNVVASAAGPHWNCSCGKNGVCVISARGGNDAGSEDRARVCGAEHAARRSGKKRAPDKGGNRAPHTQKRINQKLLHQADKTELFAENSKLTQREFEN